MPQLSILQTPPSACLPPIPIKHAIALDPWLEPVPSPAKHEGGHPSYPPLLVANSPGFTIWNGHFERLARLVHDARGWLVTVMNGSRTFFSFVTAYLEYRPLHEGYWEWG